MNTKTFFLAAALLFAFTASYAQKKMASQNVSAHSSAIFNGAWKSDDGKSFTVMHDGYFNSVAQDSSGKWEDVHAGTYTVNGDNTITFKVLYSSWPDHIGSANTAEYTISGDSMKIRHFKKLTDANGNDVTSQVQRPDWVTITRMK